MKHTLCAFLFAVMTTAGFAQQNKIKTDKRLITLDTLLSGVLKGQQVAGFAVAIVDGDQVIYSKGFGYRDAGKKKPVTPNTLFAIGSSSKAFTAALLGKMEKEGKLSLDGKATSYLPQLRFYNNTMNNEISVRDMMTHRTGLSRYDFSWYVFNSANRDSLIRKVRYMEPDAGIREKWQYNNFMYLAQGMIAEKLSGKTWEQNIKEQFFIPLEMKRSNTSISGLMKDEDASLPYGSDGNDQLKQLEYYDISGMGPAGSINSCANDMANWLKMWIAKGQYNKKEILPAAYVEQASSAQMVMGGGLPAEYKDIYSSSYGLGWMISSYRGHYMVEHGGNIDGFSASVAFLPTDRLGIVVLTNQNGSAAPGVIVKSIMDRMLKLKPIDWNGKTVKQIAELKKIKPKTLDNRVPGTKPSHTLESYAGSISNPAYGTLNITFKNDSLFAQFGKDKVWLKHYHYDIFEVKGIEKDGKVDSSDTHIKLSFNTGIDGKLASVQISAEPAMKATLFTYIPKAASLTLNELDKYTGTYLLNGKMEIKVYLKAQTLYVFVPGQPEYETVAMGDHNFKLKVLDGFSVKFEMKPQQDKANSVFFIQPNGTFNAERKK